MLEVGLGARYHIVNMESIQTAMLDQTEDHEAGELMLKSQTASGAPRSYGHRKRLFRGHSSPRKQDYQSKLSLLPTLTAPNIPDTSMTLVEYHKTPLTVPLHGNTVTEAFESFDTSSRSDCTPPTRTAGEELQPSKAWITCYSRSCSPVPVYSSLEPSSAAFEEQDRLKEIEGKAAADQDLTRSLVPSLANWRLGKGVKKSWKRGLFVKLTEKQKVPWQTATTPKGPPVAHVAAPCHRLATYVGCKTKRPRTSRDNRKCTRRKHSRSLIQLGYEDLEYENNGCLDSTLCQTPENPLTYPRIVRQLGRVLPPRGLKYAHPNTADIHRFPSVVTHESFVGVGVAEYFILKENLRQERTFACYRATCLIDGRDFLLTAVDLRCLSDKEQHYRLRLLKRLQRKGWSSLDTVFERGIAWVIKDALAFCLGGNWQELNGRWTQWFGGDALIMSDNSEDSTPVWLERGTETFEAAFPPLVGVPTRVWPARKLWPSLRSTPVKDVQEKKRIAQRQRRCRKRQAKRASREQNKLDTPTTNSI